MSSPPAISCSLRTGRGLCGLGFLLVCIIAIGAGLVALDRRDMVYASYRREMNNLGIALAEQTTRSLQAVDLVLRETQRQVLAQSAAGAAPIRQTMASEGMNRFLARHSKNLPQVDFVALIANDGTLVNGSRFWPTPPLSVADRDYFIHLRDHDGRQVFVSEPVRARIDSVWTFFLARRIDGPHGEFLGIVIAGVDARFFENFYRAITLQPGGSLALLSRDGTMLARYPHAESMVGSRLASASPWYRYIRDGGSYHSTGLVDGERRFVSVHPLRDYPLVVTVTTSEETVLGEWRRQSLFIGAGALCMAAGALAVFGALAVRSRRLEAANAGLADAAAALRANEARFRDFALTSSDWFWESDEHQRFTWQSDEIRAFGQDPSARIGKTRIDLSGDAEREPEKWREHLATLERREPFRNFIYARSLNGEPVRMISVSGSPLFGADHRFLGYRGSARDVTEAVLAERALHEAKAAAEAANQAKSQFLANVSHELRTPLNAILGFSEMLELGLVGRLRKKQTEYVRLIRYSGDHLHQVINDILDFAKVDAGKLDLHEEEGVEPHRVVESCLAIVAERAKAEGVALSSRFAEKLPLLVADSTRLKQVLLNLLSNAVKFSDPGGSVVVSVAAMPDGGVAFSVSDDGPGMTPAEIEIAMEPFGQVDGGLARPREGTGLGLPLARRLAELHGGQLLLESVKGSGTTATLLLPPTRVAPPPEAPAHQPHAAAA